MFSWFKRNIRYVTMVVLREVNIKVVLEPYMDAIMDEDMEEGEDMDAIIVEDIELCVDTA
jgi:hypothetical protein